MVFLGVIACTHRVSTWSETPPAAVSLATTEVAVLAEERACRGVADQLVQALTSRPGINVSPQADVRVIVRNCSTDLRADVDVTVVETADGATDERDVRIVGAASAEVVVDVDGNRAVIREQVRRDDDSSTENRSASGVEGQLHRDLGFAFAQRIAPLPETIRRRMYRDAEPGTAEELHNLAVEAEMRGDLSVALELALEAYAADPTARGIHYVEALRARAEATGYALSVDD